MKYIDDDVLGGQSRPIHNNFELTNAMHGRKNCFLYTVGTFRVNNQIYKMKNCKFNKKITLS